MVQASPNAVFYATSYHPIQAGSIDGTDIVPHDNAVHRALIASTTGLYDPTGDVKAEGDPYCTVFVGGLTSSTSESTLHEAMSKYGQIRRLRIVRNIVTGASIGYAFVEYENEKEMLKAYEGAHMSSVDEHTVLVDYNRQQLMPGWIPRRFGGGFGGRKESGQLRFGGRERPFRAPLRAIPHAELEKLRIPLPPEGNYMARYQIPAPPRRPAQNLDDHKHRRSYSPSVPSGQVSDNRFRELKSSRRGSETSIAMLWSRESPPAEYRRGRDSEVGFPRDLREGGIHREGTRSSDMRRSSGRQHVGDRGRSFPESSQPEEQVRRGEERDHQEHYEKDRHRRWDGDDKGQKLSRKHSRLQEGYRYSQKLDSEDIEQDRGRPRKRDHR